MKIVVTGGAGFIGSAVCGDLAAEPTVTEVVALDDLSTGDRHSLEDIDGVRLIEGSVLDDHILYTVLNGASSVVHLAAQTSVKASMDDPLMVHRINVTGTLRVLEACRRLGVPHLIMASSAAVYGTDSPIPVSESYAPNPMSLYGASKLAAESYSLAYSRGFGLGVLLLRFFNVFGPRQDLVHYSGAVVPAFILAASAGQPLTILGDGSQTRDFIFVDSVSRLISTAVIKRIVSDKPVNVGSGTRISLLQLAEIISGLIGQKLTVECREARIADIRHSQADISRLRELFGELRQVDFRTGLLYTLEWYKRNSLSVIKLLHRETGRLMRT